MRRQWKNICRNYIKDVISRFAGQNADGFVRTENLKWRVVAIKTTKIWP